MLIISLYYYLTTVITNPHIIQEELLQRISRKLDVLRAEDMALKEEMNMNEELGRHVSSLVMILNI